MPIQIIAVGQKVPVWAEQAYQEYAKRFPKAQAVKLTTIQTAARKTGQTVDKLKQQEADRIIRQIRPGDLTLAMDEHGRQWTTSEWGEQYRQWQQHPGQVNFVIGGPDGLAQDFLNKAQQTIALGAMTLPHALARVVLIEQLYRARSLATGHPYHRE